MIEFSSTLKFIDRTFDGAQVLMLELITVAPGDDEFSSLPPNHRAVITGFATVQEQNQIFGFRGLPDNLAAGVKAAAKELQGDNPDSLI